MARVSIIILNYNGKRYLEKYIPILKESVPEDLAKIIVADNASTDGSVKFLVNTHPDVEIFNFEKNYGFAEGYNIAIGRVKTEFVLLLNSDVEVTPGFLEPLVEYMDNNQRVAACQPKIKQFIKRDYFETAGAAGGLIDILGYPFCRGRIMGHLEQDKGQYDKPAIIFWASGACMLVRRDDFEDYGGFDSEFFAHQEEIDLCFRFNARGRKVAYVPESTVYHVGGGTLAYNNPKKTYLNFRNNLLMLYKNLKPQHLAVVAIVRLFMDYLAALMFLLTFKPKNAYEVAHARWIYHKMKFQFREKRAENMEKTIVKDVPAVYKRSIVFDYYVLRKRSI